MGPTLAKGALGLGNYWHNHINRGKIGHYVPSETLRMGALMMWRGWVTDGEGLLLSSRLPLLQSQDVLSLLTSAQCLRALVPV